MQSASRVGDILLKARLVDELQLRSALSRQAQWGGRLGKHVTELGFVRESAVAEAIATSQGLQRFELGAVPRDAAALAKVDVQVAEEKGVFPMALRDNGKTLWLAMADPTDLETVDNIVARTGCRIRVGVAGEKEIIAAIYRHYRNQEPPAALVRESSVPSVSNEEFKLTDIHGNTMQVPMAGQPQQQQFQPAAPAVPPQSYSIPIGTAVARPTPVPSSMPPPAHRPTPLPQAAARRVPTPQPVPQAARPGELPPEVMATLHPSVVQHLQRMQSELDKTTKVLRGLIDLCVEKQVFNNDEVRAAIARFVR